jgi:transposase
MNSTTSTKTKVLRLRLKDKHAQYLRDLASEVNFVWNYCNELQITMFNREHRFLSGYDTAGLGIREWTCVECGAVHDRNVNAAKNILAAGRRRLAEGIPALSGRGRTSRNHHSGIECCGYGG